MPDRTAMPPTPLLFLPGFMCDARLFWHQIITFSARRGVIVAPLAGATIEEMADTALALAPPEFIPVGHWLGGLVAMEILRRAPERVRGLALMNVSPLAERPAEAGLREQRIIRARTGRLDEVMLEEVPATALAPGAGRTDVQAMMLEMAGALGPDIFTDQSRALMRRPDQQRALRSAKVRTLLLCGEHDTICPPRRHEFLGELMTQAVFRPIAGAGHLTPLEQPLAVTRALGDWLETAPRAGQGRAISTAP